MMSSLSDKTSGANPWKGADLWDFSLAIYDIEEVREACLAAQDQLDADVNVLLLCCWLAATGRGAVDAEDFARLSQATSIWHTEVVKPLRAARRRLSKPPGSVSRRDAEAFRDQVANIELKAEHIEQTVLTETIGRAPVVHNLEYWQRDMRQSLATYFTFIGASQTNLTESLITVLSEACRSPAANPE
jgi:uncharacterized protein (TIGR02444 family)